MKNSENLLFLLNQIFFCSWNETRNNKQFFPKKTINDKKIYLFQIKVFHAVFDRSIPKLIEILKMKDLDNYKYRDALITLNEMVSHQVNLIN